MTRISIALVAVFALVVCACERQPVPGQPIVTHTHGSNGDPRLEGEHAAEHKTNSEHAKTAEKKEGAPHPAAEEKPTFFPEKK
jgi:hypothetical protein